MTIRILLADDQPLLRQGFRLVLESQPDMEIVGEAGDGAEAVRLTLLLTPDVVLMDVRMPRMDGIEATRADRRSSPCEPRVVILTTFDIDEYAYAGLRAGASGFLLKDVMPLDLVEQHPGRRGRRRRHRADGDPPPSRRVCAPASRNRGT